MAATPASLFLTGATAAITGAFALLVALDRPRDTPHLFLAGFLLLIAGNQVANVLRGIATADATQLELFRVSTVFSSLDPFFLYYFAAVYPKRNELYTRTKLGLVGAGAVVLSSLAIVRVLPGDAGVFNGAIRVLWSGYTALVYTVILAAFARRLRSEDSRGPTPFVFAGLAVATIPAWPRVVQQANILAGRTWTDGTEAGLLFATIVAAVGLFAWWIFRPGSERPVESRWPVVGLVAGTLAAVFAYLTILNAGLVGLGVPRLFSEGALRGLRHFGSPLKWTLFCVFLSVALFRYRLLDLSLRTRRASARVLSAIAVVGAGGLVLWFTQSAVQGQALVFDGADLLVLAVLAVASQGAKSLRDRIASLVYGAPEPADRAKAPDAYERAAKEAVEAGRNPRTDPDLARLREAYDLDDQVVSVLHDMARSLGAGPLETDSRVAGRYRVGRLLDSGGSGRAFLARDELLERDVVLKEVRGDGVDGVLDEARATTQLNHPNVLTVYDVLQRGDASILVTEYAPGGSLADRLDEGSLSVAETVDLVEDVLDGLAALHEEGIVHRDLKPSNVLFGAGGRPVIADFGIARLQADVTQTSDTGSLVLGTPAFMAPEQIRGDVATEATDLYAVGLLLDRCLDAPVPAPLAAVRDTALAEDPDDRYGSAEEMRAALREASTHLD